MQPGEGGERKDDRVSSDQRPAPERIAHYRIDSVAATGGTGVVYRATDEAEPADAGCNRR